MLLVGIVMAVILAVTVYFDAGCAHVMRPPLFGRRCYRPVIVRLALQHGLIFKVCRDGRRRRLPFQRGAAPWIVGSIRLFAQRGQQIRRP